MTDGPEFVTRVALQAARDRLGRVGLRSARSAGHEEVVAWIARRLRDPGPQLCANQKVR